LEIVVLSRSLFFKPNNFLVMRKTTLTLSYLFISFLALSQTLKSPDEFLPHQVGVQFTAHHQLVSYFEHVAQNKPEMVKLMRFGTTPEERPQILVAISSKENIANLEEIRLNNLRRVGLEKGKADNSNPISIVWIGYSIHGNEPAGSECSMKVIYELVSGKNPQAQAWLKNTVVLIDPSQNPDGYDRYTHWYRDVCNMLPDVDKSHNEHLEPWPGGRVNHYLFDLNRDWAWATQVETRNRIKMYKQWMPHVHPDIHEQGSNEPYYFAPAAEPYHKYITPFQRQFQVEIGKNHAKYFDKNGWLYFTREVFDLFYPSYGDTYPTFNGSIGMTYEQGGIGAGRAVMTESGDTLMLQDRVEHHFTTSLSTIEVASLNAKNLVENFTSFFEQRSKNPVGDYKTYVIKASNGLNKLQNLTKLLDIHKIQYGTVATNRKISGVDYVTQKETSIEITSKDLVISAYQPLSTLTQVLFDPKAELSDSVTYDITTWALPYAWGLESIASKQTIAIEKPFQNAPYENNLKENARPYAYVCAWKSVYNAKFLSKVLGAGVATRTASMPFEIEGKSYPAGTLILTRADNKDIGELFDQKVQSIALSEQQEITGVNTGMVTSGYDFGSSKVRMIRVPRVLMFGGEGTNNNAFGHLWNYFEKDIQYNVSILPIEKLRKTTLEDFDVIILADGSYSFETVHLEKLKAWTSAGGKLILLEEAITFFEDQKGFSISKYADRKAKDAAEEKQEKDNPFLRLESHADFERRGISNLIPGAIFKLKIDNSHPLAYGLPNTYYSLKTNTLHYAYLKDGANVGRIEGEPEVIGFAGSKVIPLMKNSVVFGVQPLGKGNVVYLMDSPVFRGFWEQGKLLLSNAIFMVGN
jgi:Zinc carboxypeptidase